MTFTCWPCSNRVWRNQVLKIYCIFDARPYDADISTILLVKFERRSSLPPLSKTPRISPRPVADPLLRLEINLLCIESPWFVISISVQHIREEWRKFEGEEEIRIPIEISSNFWRDYFEIILLFFFNVSYTDIHERKV